ncbi:MAG: hypothetical protein LBD91_03985 [Prevotellaceae bacterium]|jgi:uncharacterized protein YfaS (alpha-2-macroglobulin family)|nr:hypothetical protein [Prevotellaceae bacterium]
MKQFIPFVMAAVVMLQLSACGGPAPSTGDFNPYITACTGGHAVSTNDVVQVRLAVDYYERTDDDELLRNLFKISPAAAGEAFWVDGNTVGFRPAKRLRSGTEYTVRFHVAKLFPEAGDGYETFTFSFTTVKPSFTYNIYGLQIYDDDNPDTYYLKGSVLTADAADAADVEKLLAVRVDGHKANVQWQHEESNVNEHSFTVGNLHARETPYHILLNWSGKPIGYDFMAADTVAVPKKGAFTVLGVKVNADNNSIECHFSQPLDGRQKFASFIQLDFPGTPHFMASSNKLEIFLPRKPTLPVKLTISKDLRAKSGETLAGDYDTSLLFEELKPLVRAIGKGVIMPNSPGLTLPFQAVSLRAVDVLVYRTYESNILQFLQVNNLDGRRELNRVAKPIARKTIRLDENKSLDLRQWNTFSIDLASIISPEPGAIYTVKIAFTRKYSLYSACPGSGVNDDELLENKPNNGNASYNDDDDDGDAYYEYYYSGSNPCSESYYYGSNHFIIQNILATDIGLVAKRGNENHYLVFVTSLLTAQPMNGVKVELYDYQQQKIGEAVSDGNGVAQLTFTGKPYVIVARQDVQKSYLRIDNGLSLSLSTFDVSGTRMERGLKGYLYGERGVWRPGDTLFLTFVLEDRLHTLPATHPVTFELYNVNNQLVSRQVRTEGQNGFYTFACPTDPDAPTGNWNAYVKVGGASFSKTLRIATVKPNRMKIEVTLDHDPVESGQPISGAIAAQWLHGAKTAGNEADVAVELTPVRTVFDAYKDYSFDDITKPFPDPCDERQRGRLNSDGIMRFNIPVKTNEQTSGKLRADIAVRVFEDGGEFSVDRFSVEVSPYDAYVGLKMPKGVGYYDRLPANIDHTFEVVALNAAGKPLRRSLDVEIFRNEWSWWWFSADGNLADYSYRLFNNRLFSTKIQTGANGRASFTYKLEYPEWGLLLVRVTDPESGHRVTRKAYIDWWGYGRGEDNGNTGVAILSFQTDKDKYMAGEKAVVTIPSNDGAKAIVSVEKGGRVISSFRVDCKGPETAVTIPATAEMTPNAYIAVTLLQPHRQTQNDLPMRLYGVIPLMVEDPATRIQPVIKMPDIIRPEQPFTVHVSETGGKEMTYTLAIVDEGLLDLTRFKTPDLWEFFFQREALGVRTWDLYNYVMGAYGGKIEQLFAIGGGDFLDASKGDDKANRFKPVVKFAGPFTLKAGKTAEHRFTISNYVGSVRTMVVAGNRTAYGHADKTTPVRSPLMVQATLPRVVGPGEEVTLPAAIFAMEPQVKNVKVELQSGDLFEPLDGVARTLVFPKTGDELVKFHLRVKNKLGVARVKVIATSGAERAENEIEIAVRAANPTVVLHETAIVNSAQTVKLNVKLPGLEGTNSAQLEVSSIPPLNLGTRLNYLMQYPHGCLEQTTSAAFPQLFLPFVVDMPDKEKERAATNVKAAIQRLAYFVRQDGSFSYWPGGTGYSCEWTNNYAGHFLIEAERKGYSIPGNMKENWLACQQKTARNWTPTVRNDRYACSQNDLIQAYRLYVLALAKKEELSAMNRLKERSDLSVQAGWMLAGAYALAGQKEAALKIVQNLPVDARNACNGASDTYGSADRDDAITLDVLTLVGNKENAFRMAKQISDAMNTDRWMSTQTTAYCLLALSKYALDEKGGLYFTYALGNGKQQTVKSAKSIWNIALNDLPAAARHAQIAFDNKGGNTLFVRLSVHGTPPAGSEQAAEHDLGLTVRYLHSDGSEIDVARLAQGTDFVAEVRVKNPGQRGNYANLALTQIVPSGWEITDDRLHDDAMPEGVTYRDLRDDRVYAYFDLRENRTLTIRLHLRAAYVGKYYLPAIACEAMYDAAISANTTGKRVEVY